MEKIDLHFDQENFPQLNMRYDPDRLWELLVNMCRKLNVEVTEANLYSMAAMLESDLQHMFA